MDVFAFERLDSAGMAERGGAFSTLEEAVNAVKHSYRSRPSKDFNDLSARQDPRLFFRDREIDGGWIVEVFPNQAQLAQPLATYKITKLLMAAEPPKAE